MSRNNFEVWLSENTKLKENTVKGYGATINSISKIGNDEGLFFENLYSVEDIETLDRYIKKLKMNKKYRARNAKNHRKLSLSMYYYKEFIEESINEYIAMLSATPITSFQELYLKPFSDKTENNSSNEIKKINSNKSKKINYESKNKRNKAIGDRGELVVLNYEEEKLRNAGKGNLVDKIDHIALSNDSVGYDILSFDEKGNKIYIEVKSTVAKSGNANFYLTANELEMANNNTNYWIYIVFEVDTSTPKICRIEDPFNTYKDDISLIPDTYRVKIGLQ